MTMDRTLFIGIGPPKTGTSWLYGYLLRHPEVFMSRVKELQYFSARFGPKRCLEWDETFRKRAAEMQAMYHAKPTPQREEILAALNARVAMIDDPSAYVRYFEHAAGPEHKVVGEISPSYFITLREHGFKAVRRVSSKLRILCTLRDPVERLWSEVRFRKRHYDNDSFDPVAEFERALQVRELAGWRQDGHKLEMIGKMLGPEEFRVEFYESLFTKSAMRDLCQWLDVEFMARHFDHTANPSQEIPLPTELWARARDHFAPMYEAYKQHFGDRLPESWGIMMDRRRRRAKKGPDARARRRVRPKRKNVLPAQRTLFVGIGPARTGTTWLHDYLIRHPEVFMSPVKEMEYFSVQYLPNRYGRWNDMFRKRVTEAKAKYDAEPKAFRHLILTAMKARVAMIDDRSAYMEYFEDAAGPYHKVVGEISPTYIELEEDGLQAIRATWPKVRLLCTLRDPVDRLWSELRFRKQRQAQFDPIGEFEKELRKPQPLPDRKLPMLERMSGEGEFRVEFYETLFTEKTVAGICEWLGVEFVVPDFSRRARPGPAIPLPADLAAEARVYFAPLYDDYKARFGDRLPKSWRV